LFGKFVKKIETESNDMKNRFSETCTSQKKTCRVIESFRQRSNRVADLSAELMNCHSGVQSTGKPEFQSEFLPLSESINGTNLRGVG
jgi:hypothetical protein